MATKRRRFKQTDTLETRLAQFAQDMRVKAEQKPLGDERSSLLKRAYNADQAIDLERQLREHAPSKGAQS
ncbi:hypothetical protein QRQ56_31025 [Bradyrhizobium sp. U531]|uniref:hypothetical protein n=1 Tax=Bradyrhizobium sp. U531 TaxID=3053458 RepID=UPI003F423946